MPQGTERPSCDKGEQYEEHNAPECRKEMRTMNLSPAPVRRCPHYYVHESSVTPRASMEPRPGCDVECNLVSELNISPASKIQHHSTPETVVAIPQAWRNPIRFSPQFPMFHFPRETGDRQDWVTEIRGRIAPLWQFNILLSLLCA